MARSHPSHCSVLDGSPRRGPWLLHLAGLPLPTPAFRPGVLFPPIQHCSLSAMRLPSPPPCPKPCRVHDLVTVCVCTGGRGEQPEGPWTGQCGQDSGPGQVRLSSGLGSALPWDSGSFLDPNLALTCPALWPLQLSSPCQGTGRVGTSWSHGAAFQVRGGASSALSPSQLSTGRRLRVPRLLVCSERPVPLLWAKPDNVSGLSCPYHSPGSHVPGLGLNLAILS